MTTNEFIDDSLASLNRIQSAPLCIQYPTMYACSMCVHTAHYHRCTCDQLFADSTVFFFFFFLQTSVTYPSTYALQPSVKPRLHKESQQVVKQIPEEGADSRNVPVTLCRCSYKPVTVGEDAGYSAQIDGPGCVPGKNERKKREREREKKKMLTHQVCDKKKKHIHVPRPSAVHSKTPLTTMRK